MMYVEQFDYWRDPVLSTGLGFNITPEYYNQKSNDCQKHLREEGTKKQTEKQKTHKLIIIQHSVSLLSGTAKGKKIGLWRVQEKALCPTDTFTKVEREIGLLWCSLDRGASYSFTNL